MADSYTLNIHNVFLFTSISYFSSLSPPPQRKYPFIFKIFSLLQLILKVCQLLFCTVTESWKTLVMGAFFPECPPYRTRDHSVSLETSDSLFYNGGNKGISSLGLPPGQPGQGGGDNFLWERSMETIRKREMDFPFVHFHQLMCAPIQH